MSSSVWSLRNHSLNQIKLLREVLHLCLAESMIFQAAEELTLDLAPWNNNEWLQQEVKASFAKTEKTMNQKNARFFTVLQGSQRLHQQQ